MTAHQRRNPDQVVFSFALLPVSTYF